MAGATAAEPLTAKRAVSGALVPALISITLVASVVSSLGAPLIPAIAAQMDASLGAAQWSLTAALLVGAVSSPLVGRLGSGPHRRQTMVVCLTLVTLGSVVSALAGSIGLLVAGRAFQGLGLALAPLTMAAARDHLPPMRAGSVIAFLSVTGAVGAGLGYPVTGLIAQVGDAAAAFWFGAVASGAALVLAIAFVPRAPAVEAERRPLDVAGAIIVGAGLLALLVALEKGTDWGWTAGPTLGLLAVAAGLLVLWVVVELRVEHPLVELRLVRRRAVMAANVTGLALGVSMYLGMSLMTQVVQLPSGMDETVFVAGLALLPLSVSSMFSSRLAPAVNARIGTRGTLPLGCLLIALAFAFFAATGDAFWEACVTTALIGLGIGFTFAAMPGLIVSSVPQAETSSAMSFYQVTRYVGFSIGSGLAVTLLRAFDGDAPVPTVEAYSSAFWVGAGLCVATAVLTWAMVSGTRAAPTPADLAHDAPAT